MLTSASPLPLHGPQPKRGIMTPALPLNSVPPPPEPVTTSGTATTVTQRLRRGLQCLSIGIL
ncbi:hypothetical protein MUK42_22562 [Musa troglodytarum]|uniref:Uncharacterized protein n=1 Tax=Musa troglodytarum TaxID=320322 RepID=A0A9E7KCC0_9LILI|nr:hypothetical protein MUK42_22562 [Musa troglodytarum]